MDRLHHVALAVPDIAAALEWYRDQFDADTLSVDDSRALLKFENISPARVLPSLRPPHTTVERENAEAFGTMTPHRDGRSSDKTQDPIGNAVEIVKVRR